MFKKWIPVVLGAAALAVGGDVLAQATAPTALTVTAASDYLQTNAQSNMTTVGQVLFILSGLAMAITWVKAQFFG